eukprot:TsM_000096000 transcript=TsM_000096000 gene=TsM_000096000
MPQPRLNLDGNVEAHLDAPDFSAQLPALSAAVIMPDVGLRVDTDMESHVAAATPDMKLEETTVDIDVTKAVVELPQVEVKADISAIEMEVSVPKPEIAVDMPRAKAAVKKEAKLPSVHIKTPKIKFGKSGIKKPAVVGVEVPE